MNKPKIKPETIFSSYAERISDIYQALPNDPDQRHGLIRVYLTLANKTREYCLYHDSSTEMQTDINNAIQGFYQQLSHIAEAEGQDYLLLANY